jgi:Tetratricopeptide repeat
LRAIPLQKKVLGEDHASTLISTHALAISTCRLGRTEEALELYRLVLGKQKKIFGFNHWETLMTLLDLCDALDYLDAGFEEMGDLCRSALAAIQPKPGEMAMGNDYDKDTVLRRLNAYLERSIEALNAGGREMADDEDEDEDEDDEEDARSWNSDEDTIA